LLRTINDRAALELLLEHGSMTRQQLVDMTGLSKPTASQLLARLEADSLVVPVGSTSGGRGPNAILYAANGAAAHVAAIDVVPSRMSTAIADLTGRVLASSVVRTPRGGDPASLVRQALDDTCTKAGLELTDLSRTVIGASGVADPSSDSLAVSTLTGWSRPGALTQVRAALDMPVYVENDVNLAAVAERALGAGRDAGSFALLWVAAGLGLAIDLGGTLHRGATGGAGEIGYMPVPGAIRRRGARERRGDFQDLVGAPAVRHLAAEHGLPSRDASATVRFAATAGGAGEPFIAELAERLATGLATIVAVLDPELVVLAGDICRAGGETLATRVERSLHGLSPLRPRVAVTGVTADPVLAGALHVALAGAREAVFGTPGGMRAQTTTTETATGA
jgi:predicted NBD/HSP70 family sugar kinase